MVELSFPPFPPDLRLFISSQFPPSSPQHFLCWNVNLRFILFAIPLWWLIECENVHFVHVFFVFFLLLFKSMSNYLRWTQQNDENAMSQTPSLHHHSNEYTINIAGVWSSDPMKCVFCVARNWPKWFIKYCSSRFIYNPDELLNRLWIDPESLIVPPQSIFWINLR